MCAGLWPYTPATADQDMEPPKDVLIEVRVKEDCGDILTDTGTIRSGVCFGFVGIYGGALRNHTLIIVLSLDLFREH